jgi:hypothetical protein
MLLVLSMASLLYISQGLQASNPDDDFMTADGVSNCESSSPFVASANKSVVQ